MGSVIGSSCVSGCNGDAGCAELLLASQSGAALLVGDAFGTRGSSQPWAREVMADRRSDRNCRGDLNVSASLSPLRTAARSPVPERQLEGHQPGRSRHHERHAQDHAGRTDDLRPRRLRQPGQLARLYISRAGSAINRGPSIQRGWRGSAVRLSAGSVMADTCDPPCKIVWRNPSTFVMMHANGGVAGAAGGAFPRHDVPTSGRPTRAACQWRDRPRP